MSLPRMNPLAAKLMGGADFRRRLRDQILARAAEIGIPVPDVEEARALLPDVLELQQRARDVLAADRANNWGHDR